MEAQDERSVHSNSTPSQGALTGLRVIELADEQAEYCGLTLAGLGADVVKIEPPGGSPTRRIGPFYEDREDPERSLFFWQYNRGKRSIVLDLRQPQGQDQFRSLVATADVLLESTPKGELDALGLGVAALLRERSEEHTSELQSHHDLVCRLLLEKTIKILIFAAAGLTKRRAVGLLHRSFIMFQTCICHACLDSCPAMVGLTARTAASSAPLCPTH